MCDERNLVEEMIVEMIFKLKLMHHHNREEKVQ